MATYQELYARNMEAIKEQLATREPSFMPSAEYDALTNGSGSEARTALLAAKERSPELTNLTNLVYQFHHKLAEDKNSHFALTEVLMKSAVPHSLDLDKKVNNSNAEEYPLFGFVLGLKETFLKKGTKSTGGMFINDYVCEENVPFIEYLESKGAVFLCKTNVPQMLFAMESNNHIYGSVRCPWDKTRSAGGSSGGDGCLTALKQVHAAIGSDIAGSGRIPAAFCGVNSIMLSPARVDRLAHMAVFDHKDFYPTLPDAQYGIRPTFAVTGRQIKDIETVAHVMVDYWKQNFRIPPVPWNSELANKTPKRVGVLLEFDNLMDLPAVNRRAMQMARDALTSQGIELFEIDMRDCFEDLLEWCVTMYGKNKMLMAILNNKVPIQEPLVPAFKNLISIRKLPLFVRRILAHTHPDQKVRCFLRAQGNEIDFNTQYVMNRIFTHRNTLIQRMKEKGVEVLLSHSMFPSPQLDTSGDLSPLVAYMFIWNNFGWTSGHFTVTRVAADEQKYESRFDGKMEKRMHEVMRGSKGLPVGIQVAAPEWSDEKVIAVMKALEAKIKFE